MTLNSNIFGTVTHSTIKNTVFWKNLTRPFRHIYVNCLNRHRFLAVVSTKLQNLHFFRQFKDHKLRKKTWKLDKWPLFFFFFFFFFSPLFSALDVCNIHFWIWKYSNFIFMWSTLWFILVCKTPQFLAKSYQFGQSSHFSKK